MCSALPPRVTEAIKILREFNIKATTYLDLGCSNGRITEIIAKVVNAKEVYGIDIDSNALEEARSRGIKTFNLDLSKDRFPLNDDSVDLITAFEVIEHLANPDNMLREAFRVLRKGGYLLLSTPNLASWVNRITFLLGYQPYNVEVSIEILAGVPIKHAKPSGHIRAFTLRALKELLTYHGFKIIKIRGTYDTNPRIKLLISLDKIFSRKTSLARRLVALATK